MESNGVAAVHHQVLAGDIGGSIGGEEYDGPLDVVMSSHASQKNLAAILAHEGLLMGLGLEPPGEIAFTRTLRGPPQAARYLVSPIIPCL